MNDLISRQAVEEAIEFFLVDPGDGWNDIANERNRVLEYVSDKIMRMPPAQQWIPVKYRPMTEEEKAYWMNRFWYDGECDFGDNMMFDCQMPDDGQKILVCSQCGNIWVDTHEDEGGLMSLEENGDWEDIVAWMPLPEPYKEENNEQVQG